MIVNRHWYGRFMLNVFWATHTLFLIVLLILLSICRWCSDDVKCSQWSLVSGWWSSLHSSCRLQRTWKLFNLSHVWLCHFCFNRRVTDMINLCNWIGTVHRSLSQRSPVASLKFVLSSPKNKKMPTGVILSLSLLYQQQSWGIPNVKSSLHLYLLKSISHFSGIQ